MFQFGPFYGHFFQNVFHLNDALHCDSLTPKIPIENILKFVNVTWLNMEKERCAPLLAAAHCQLTLVICQYSVDLLPGGLEEDLNGSR